MTSITHPLTSPLTSSSSSSFRGGRTSGSLWSDLPRRLTTIAIGLPLVAFCLSKKSTASLFFQIVHILACMEWIHLERNPSRVMRRGGAGAGAGGVGQIRDVKNTPIRRKIGNKFSNSSSSSTDDVTSWTSSATSGATTNGASTAIIVSTMAYCLFNWFLAKTDLPQFFLLMICAILFLVSFTSQQSPIDEQSSSQGQLQQHSSHSQKGIKNQSPQNHLNINTNPQTPSSSSCGGGSSSSASSAFYFFFLSPQHAIMGIIFLTIPFTSWYKLCLFPHVTAHILWIVWNVDNGALLFGRMYSSRKQQRHFYDQPHWLQQISPNKSIQGLCGGLVLGFIAHLLWNAYVGQYLFPTLSVTGAEGSTTIKETAETIISTTNITGNNDDVERKLSFLSSIIMPSATITPDKLPVVSHFNGLIICFLATMGDLLESSIKRYCHVKDTDINNIQYLPGHGGIIDRFDSSFLVAVYYYSYLFQK